MASIVDRFLPASTSPLMREALLQQQIVLGDEAIAEALAAEVEVVSFGTGETLIDEGGEDNDLYFIVSGTVEIVVRGRRLNKRVTRQQVGEMAAINPGARRSATVCALEPVVAARISEPSFARIATEHPVLWKRLAQELADRLLQRNVHVRPKNEIPTIFIGSSTEALVEAKALKSLLERPSLNVRLWSEDVFVPSSNALQDLANEATTSDFAILVLSADDKVESRGVDILKPRDNVLFELGLFMGALGKDRAFMVNTQPDGITLPTDLDGVTQLWVTKDFPLTESATAVLKRVETLGTY
jgi:predicted nucleotide-binding protein